MACHERELELLTRLVDGSSGTATESGGDGGCSGTGWSKVVLTKYVEGDDVEAFLTTF